MYVSSIVSGRLLMNLQGELRAFSVVVSRLYAIDFLFALLCVCVCVFGCEYKKYVM